MTSPNFLTRAYNSTLGVPQQVLYRLWRALKDEDPLGTVFSREGLLAPELLPVLGLAASHETDVEVSELIGEKGLGKTLAADILLDPMTYLTAGATAFAKGAKSVNVAAKGGGLLQKGSKVRAAAFRAKVGDLSQFETAGDLARRMADGVADGSLNHKVFKKTIAELEKHPGKNLKELMASGRQEELLFSIPGLSRFGAKWRAPSAIQQHKSWFALQNNLIYKQKLGLAGPLDYAGSAIGDTLKAAGPAGAWLSDAVHNVLKIPGAVRSGFKTPLGASITGDLKEVTKDSIKAGEFLAENRKAVDALESTEFDKVSEKIADLMEDKGLSLEDAFDKALRSKAGGYIKNPAAMRLAVFGEGPLPENAVAVLEGFRRTGQEADALLKNQVADQIKFNVPELPEKFEDSPMLAAIWDSSHRLGRLLRKGFKTDTPHDSTRLEALATEHARFIGTAENAARATIPGYVHAVKRIAGSSDTEPEVLNRFFQSWEQSYWKPEEMRLNLEALNSGDLERIKSAGQHFRDAPNRVRASIVALREISGVTNLQELEKFLGDEGRAVGFLAEEATYRLQDNLFVKASDLYNSTGLEHLLDKPVGFLSQAKLKLLRTQARTPELRAKLKHLERRRQKGKVDTIPEQFRKAGRPKFKRKDTHGMVGVMADFMLAEKDIARAVKNGTPISPLTIMRVEKAQIGMDFLLRDTLTKAFPKADLKDIDTVFGAGRRASKEVLDYIGFSGGAPLGYAARLQNPKFKKALTQLIRRTKNVLGADKEVDAMFRRVKNRDLTIEDINLLEDKLLGIDKGKDAVEAVKGGRTLLKDIKAHLGGEIPENTRYHDDYLADVLTRFTSAASMNATADLVDNVLSSPAAAQADGIIGGKIVKVYDGLRNEIHTSPEKLKVSGRKTSNLKQTDITVDRRAAYLDIERADGSIVTVDLEQWRGMGAKTLGIGPNGDTAGKALVAFDAGRGGSTKQFDVGGWFIAGDQPAIEWMRQAASPPVHKYAEAFKTYDTINFGIKKFQTVLRASHHLGNLISGIFQTRAAGASVGATIQGHILTAQMLTGTGRAGGEFLDALRLRTGIPAGTGLITKPARVVDQLNGLIAGKSLAELKHLRGDTFTNIDDATDLLDITSRMVADGLFDGIQAVEDIKLGGGLSPEEIIKGISANGKPLDDMFKATRYPEIFARMSTVMALHVDGHALSDAIALARGAHVDYSDLTKFERSVMKRAVPYYTFARKYTPFALDRMARDPQLIVGWQKAIQNSGYMGIDENGTPILSYENLELDMGRTNANLDAMMSLIGLTESLTGAVGTDIQRIDRPGYMSLDGGALGPLVTGLGLGGEGVSIPAGAQAAWDSVFVSRFVEAVATATQGGGFQPLADSALHWFLPADLNAEPGKARKFQMNLARRTLRSLEFHAKEAKTTAQLEAIQEDARKLRNAIDTVQRDFQL